jgi:AcrR family transcriptional regulator
MVRNANLTPLVAEVKRKGRPQTLNRQHVLDVAMDALWTSDAANVSMNAICQLAGVSKPAVYREFGSEDGLIHAVLAQYEQQLMPKLVGIFDENNSIDDALKQLIDFVSNSEFTQTGCLHVKLSGTHQCLGEQTKALVTRLKAGLLLLIESFIVRKANAGHWLSQYPAPIAVQYIFVQFTVGLNLRAAAIPSSDIKQIMILAFKLDRTN